MSKLDTLHLNDAVGGKNKFERNRTHLTTLEIAEIVPILHEDMVTGDFYTIQESIFSRLAPLAVPTYGHFNFKTATFFVPYYQIFQGAEAFFGGKTISRGHSIQLPTFTKLTLLSLFNTYYSEEVTSPSSSAAYDYVYTESGTQHFKKLTSNGKWVYKVLKSLGYEIPNIHSGTGVSISSAPTATDKLNALPLLCFFKAYNDYMAQSQRFDTSLLTNYLETIKTSQVNSTLWINTTGVISSVGLHNMFDCVYLQYENDYFTSCWQSPNNPIANTTGDVSSIVYNYGASSTSTIESNSNGVFNYSTNSLSQRTLDFLRTFDSWVRRNNYSGSKDVQRIYSRFGIMPEDYKASYCHLLNFSNTQVQVGDVTSLTDSQSSTEGVPSGAVLGEYAGKGIVNGDTGYKFTSSDYGMLITLGWITVQPMYANGFDRTVLKTNCLDFYNPEFDGLGGNPVSQQELFCDRKNSQNYENRDNTIFGFNERYDEYRTGNLDQITGDFLLYEDMDSWHFNRNDLKALQNNGAMIAQNAAFNSIENTNSGSQFNRIFNAEAEPDSMSDHFYVSANFKVTAFRPMKSLNEVPNLGVGNTVVPRNGNTLN